jgi:hypothetical protein
MRRTLLLAALLCTAGVAHAQSIVNPGPAFSWRRIDAFQPFGQSFTAVSSAITTIGFSFDGSNFAAGPSPVTVSLRAGNGVTGPVIAERSISPIFAPLFDASILSFADFTGTSLTVGSMYTAVLSTTTAFWGVYSTNSDSYAGGSAYVSGDAVADDLVFQVNSATVPEPFGGALLAIGMGALFVARRRRAPAAR